MVLERPGRTRQPARRAGTRGTLIGKRYVDAAGTVELLCVKPGKGSLAIAGVALQLKDAKPLPASD